jgi:hypothetical protein
MRSQTKVKRYSELIQLQTFEERYKYLRLYGTVGADTFGFDRHINQQLYKSYEWKRVRDIVIARDNACDLAMEGHDLMGRIYVHHMNPIDIEDIEQASDYLLNPEYLICVSMDTHNAIHFGNESFLEKNKIVVRASNDMSPWRK